MRSRHSKKQINVLRGEGTVALVASAESSLASGRFREAIECYKELLKHERNPAWIDGLALSYAGRARSLASKSLFGEALEVWRNRSSFCGKPLVEGPYVDWLVWAGETKECIRLLSGRSLPDDERSLIEYRLSGFVLTAPEEIVALVPSVSPLIGHRAFAMGAVSAYCSGDASAMDENLKAIPFRSPYRDLRLILKASVLLETDPEEARVAIAKIPEGGPFERLAAPVRVALLPDRQWLSGLSSLDEDGRQMLLDVKGCPENMRPMIMDLAKLGDSANPSGLFDLIIHDQEKIPKECAASLSRRLIPYVQNGMKYYIRKFGALPLAESHRLCALEAELSNDLEKAENQWIQACMALKKSSDPEDKRRAALIIRSKGIKRKRTDDSDVYFDIALLEESLELDPEDKDTHLELIKCLRAVSELKEARKCVDAALSRFPQNASILQEAVETALANNSFKKAISFAKRLIKLDPINSSVRTTIGQAHLSHARKQIRVDNLSAARRELEAAKEWLREKKDLANLNMLFAIVHDDGKSIDEVRLAEAVSGLGGNFPGGLHVLLEANRLKLDPIGLLRRADIDLSRPPAPAEVLALAHTLDAMPNDEKELKLALGPLRPPIRRAAIARFPESDRRMICEALLRHREFDLVRAYAEEALKHWPDRPVFLYFKMAALYGNDSERIKPREFDDLQKAAEEARRQGDERTGIRIRELFMQIADSGDEESDLIDPGDLFEAIRALGGEKNLIDLVREMIGEKLFREMEKRFGGNKDEFLREVIEMIS